MKTNKDIINEKHDGLVQNWGYPVELLTYNDVLELMDLARHEAINSLEKKQKFYEEPKPMSWYEAMEKYKNHPEWRLPTRKEFANMSKSNYDSFEDDYYWSSSEYTEGSCKGIGGKTPDYLLAWRISIKLNHAIAKDKSCLSRVRVIRKEIIKLHPPKKIKMKKYSVTTVTETKTRRLKANEFFCNKCKTIHKKSAYAIAQYVMRVDLIFTCVCKNKINLPAKSVNSPSPINYQSEKTRNTHL